MKTNDLPSDSPPGGASFSFERRLQLAFGDLFESVDAFEAPRPVELEPSRDRREPMFQRGTRGPCAAAFYGMGQMLTPVAFTTADNPVTLPSLCTTILSVFVPAAQPDPV
jgi:hypothetical protein